jgi:hypothetical protein
MNGELQFSLRTLLVFVAVCAVAALFWRGTAFVALFLMITSPLSIACWSMTELTERLAQAGRPICSISCFCVAMAAAAVLFLMSIFALTGALVMVSLGLT